MITTKNNKYQLTSNNNILAYILLIPFIVRLYHVDNNNNNNQNKITISTITKSTNTNIRTNNNISKYLQLCSNNSNTTLFYTDDNNNNLRSPPTYCKNLYDIIPDWLHNNDNNNNNDTPQTITITIKSNNIRFKHPIKI